MHKTLLLAAALSFIGCAEVKPKPTIFVEVTVTEITDCHTFQITINGQKEEWVGCTLHLKTQRGVRVTKQVTIRELEFTHFYLNAVNPYKVGQKIIIGLETEDSKEIIFIAPKN